MPFHQKSVLIVDDDPDIREILEEVFHDQGFVVRTAANGEVAFRALATMDPDVIVLDIHMPIMDGVAFAHAYQARPGRHAPIVVFSTLGETPGVRGFRPASVLPKPCDLDTIIETVERQVPA
jgi:CheY-like chemotaxis protein